MEPYSTQRKGAGLDASGIQALINDLKLLQKALEEFHPPPDRDAPV